jgi:hypothetical protein
MPLGQTLELKPGDMGKLVHIWRAGAPCRPTPGGVLVLEDSAVTTFFVSYTIGGGGARVAPPNAPYRTGAVIAPVNARPQPPIVTTPGPLGAGPLVDPSAIDSTTIIEPFGIVQFGTDKDAHYVEFDLKRGVWGSVTSIDGTFYASYPLVEGSTQPVLNLRFGAGRGTKAAPGVSTVLTRTLTPPAADQFKLIPPFAVSAILIAPGPSGGARLLQYAAPGGALLSDVPIGQLDMEAIPIAAGALFWTLADAPENARVQFNLAVG